MSLVKKFLLFVIVSLLDKYLSDWRGWSLIRWYFIVLDGNHFTESRIVGFNINIDYYELNYGFDVTILSWIM